MKFCCGVFTVALAINLCASVPLLRKTNTLDGSAPENEDSNNSVMLSMSNRAGFCRNNTKCAPRQDDRSYSPWTIHGLWPSSKTNCKDNEAFDIGALKDIRAQLNESWPSFTVNTSEAFWEYEFKKHGSCAIELRVPGISNVTSYFSKTLDLSKTFNVTSYLKGVNASDDSPVALKTLNDALVKGFKNTAELYCEGQKNGTDVLQEIRLCFDGELKPRNCTAPGNCRGESVWYLKNGGSSVTFSIVLVSLLAFMALLNKGSL